MRWIVFCFFSSICFAGENTQAAQFKEKGYLWVKGFYSQEQVALIRHWAEKVHEDAGKILIMAEELGISSHELAQNFSGLPISVPERKEPLRVCRAEDILSCYPDLCHFVQGTLGAYLGDVFEEPYVPFKDKLNFKWPGGGAFSYHQDFPAFEVFGPKEFISVMVCIDPATLENGCLYIAEDWRRDLVENPLVDQELLAQGKAILPYIEGGPMHGTIVPEIVEKLSWLPLNVEPGDVVFFTSYVPHFSFENTSDASRRAMFFTFNPLQEGAHKDFYYQMKRSDPQNPMFHFGTPTNARTKGD